MPDDPIGYTLDLNALRAELDHIQRLLNDLAAASGPNTPMIHELQAHVQNAQAYVEHGALADELDPTHGPSPIESYVREQAHWRDGIAELYPDDARNQRSARALLELADHISQLPASDPRLAALESMHENAGTGVYSPGEEGMRLVSRYGFDVYPDDPDRLLDLLAAAEAAEWNQLDGPQ